MGGSHKSNSIDVAWRCNLCGFCLWDGPRRNGLAVGHHALWYWSRDGDHWTNAQFIDRGLLPNQCEAKDLLVPLCRHCRWRNPRAHHCGLRSEGLRVATALHSLCVSGGDLDSSWSSSQRADPRYPRAPSDGRDRRLRDRRAATVVR